MDDHPGRGARQHRAWSLLAAGWSLLAPVAILAVVLVVLGPAMFRTAGAEADDRRPLGPGDRALFGPVALVLPDRPAADEAGGALGTGTFVSPCHVLTAYHLAFEPDGIADDSRTYRVRATVAGLQARGRPVTWGRPRDWALLEVRPCIGWRTGWYAMAALNTGRASRQGMDVALAGYPADKGGEAAWLDPACRILGTADFGMSWVHDCMTAPGNSGGPLLRLDGSGEPCLIGMVTGFAPRDGQRSPPDLAPGGVAVAAAQFISDVLPYVADAAVPGQGRLPAKPAGLRGRGCAPVSLALGP
ncbi:trypsin-like serine peptidase [Arenibaculum pallidiluteum]|uniref:trypsin-like serine peptidase n=1 Tax=Arenibaculum pallidiluteum TaxID=2812559 RepID=UPI001A96D4DB|nr:serine protease [Arenibaculum pallidiluteum]